MSKAALYAGLSGGAKAWGNIAEKDQEAELTEAARDAQAKREKRLAQYEAKLNRENTDHEFGLRTELAKTEAGLTAKSGKTHAPKGWEHVKKVDPVTGEEKIYLYNADTSEWKDPEKVPKVATLSHHLKVAEKKYGVDMSGDETFEKFIANKDYEAAEARAKRVAEQQKKSKKPGSRRAPEPKGDPVLDNMRRTLLEREGGNKQTPLEEAGGLLSGFLKGASDVAPSRNADAIISRIQRGLESGKPPSDTQIAQLKGLSAQQLKSLGASEDLIRLIEATNNK